MKPLKNWLIKISKSIDTFCNKIFDLFMTYFRRYYLILVFAVIFVLSFLVRWVFIRYLSGDMYGALLPWFNFLKQNGGFKAMGSYPWTPQVISKPGDYPVAYINILALLSYLPLDGIVSIKLSSILFDYILAFGVIKLIRLWNKNHYFSLISFIVLVFFPTSILNSGLWGQADQMYVALVVWTLYFLIREKHGWAMVLLGFAIAIKLQTTFFLPVLVFLWLNKAFKLRSLIILFAAIFVTFIPSYIAGAPFNMPFDMYKLQITGLYKNANYGAGSIYAFFEFSGLKGGINAGAGIIGAFTAIGVAILVLFHYKVPATPKNTIYVAVLFSLLSPFVLPHMHERYFYMADAFVILYVLVYKRKYWLGLLMSFSSVLAYTHFLMGGYIFKFLDQDSVRLAALINLFLIIYLIYEAPKVLEKIENENNLNPRLN